jgi:hypothetical protein
LLLLFNQSFFKFTFVLLCWCGERVKAYENWTQARREAVHCFYL